MCRDSDTLLQAARRAGIRLLWAVASLVVGPAHATLLIIDTSVEAEYHAHPSLRSLVFVSPEMRSLTFMPPAPVFVMPGPLIYRPPSALSPYASPLLPEAGRAAVPQNWGGSAYHLDRAREYRLGARHDEAPSVYFYYGGSGYSSASTTRVAPSPSYGYPPWGWISPYPPLEAGKAHPGNRDNARLNLERARRYSKD